MAAFLSLRMDAGLPVTEDVLSGVVGTYQRIEYDASVSRRWPSRATPFDEGNDGQDFGAVVEVPEHDATLVLLEFDELIDDLVGDERGSIALILLLAAIVAGWSATSSPRCSPRPSSSSPSPPSSSAAAGSTWSCLATRVPEARAIGQALQTSAGQLQERLANEEAFAQHASHVLRTPLTGLRLDLDDLSMRTDLPEDVPATMAHAVVRIDAMDEVAGELVALSRSNSLVAGADIALRDLGTQCAQSWADALGPYGRVLMAAVEGEIDTRYTPGPIEFVLDILLADVVRRSGGAVRLTFHADEEGHLTIVVTSAGEARTEPGDDRALAKARAVTTALGGRLKGSDAGDGGSRSSCRGADVLAADQLTHVR